MEERGCGCGNSIAAIIIMVIAALIGVAYYQWHSAVEAEAARALEDRRQLVERQFAMVQDDLEEAQRWLEEGDARLLVTTLRHMEEKLQMIGAGISQTGDSVELARIVRLKGAVRNAIEAIEAAKDDQEALDTARVQLEDIQKAFDGAPSSVLTEET